MEFVAADLATENVPSNLLSGIDTVIHLAGKAHALAEVAGDESEYRRVNVGGTERLLAMAARVGLPRFVFVSSVKAAGDESESRMDESFDAPPARAPGSRSR